MIPAFFALLLVVSEWFGMLSSRTPRTPRWPAWSWIVLLLVSYAAELAIVFYAARHQYPAAVWRATMPLPVVDDRGLLTANGDLLTALMLLLAGVQSFALLALYRTTLPLRALWAGCAVLLLLSLAAPALMSFDMYGYVHDALLGLSAYAPPNVPFAGQYHVFDLWFGGPSPTLYGPLWLVLVRIVTAGAPTLLAKLFAWRVFCAILYVALVAGLRVLRLPSRIVAVAALNPGLMLQFVANGHNDLVAIVLLVYAAAILRSQMWAALGLVAVAGLVKLPYAVLGLPLLAAIRPLALRLVGSAAMLAAVAAISWMGGGSGYLHSLVGHVGSKPEDLVHRLAAVAALAAIALAFFGLRRLRAAVWAMPMLGAYLFSWYVVWGLPYALARRRIVGYLLVCFPFVTMLLESAFARTWSILLVLPAVALLSLFAPEKPVTPGPRRQKRARKRGSGARA